MIRKNFLDLPLRAERIHDGEALCQHGTLFDSAAFNTPIRFINYTVLPTGSSFGLHTHGNDNEIYVILEGSGIYGADGEQAQVREGDVLVNLPYGTHSLANTGTVPLRVLVLEVYNP